MYDISEINIEREKIWTEKQCQNVNVAISLYSHMSLLEGFWASYQRQKGRLLDKRNKTLKVPGEIILFFGFIFQKMIFCLYVAYSWQIEFQYIHIDDLIIAAHD